VPRDSLASRGAPFTKSAAQRTATPFGRSICLSGERMLDKDLCRRPRACRQPRQRRSWRLERRGRSRWRGVGITSSAPRFVAGADLRHLECRLIQLIGLDPFSGPVVSEFVCLGIIVGVGNLNRSQLDFQIVAFKKCRRLVRPMGRIAHSRSCFPPSITRDMARGRWASSPAKYQT
jgi:hypothetical protein